MQGSKKLCEYYGTLILPPEFHAGVEYEIEGIADTAIHPNNPFKFQMEKDNSLRNNGLEFKTGPLTYDQSIEAFKYLHSHITYVGDAFSDRTSTHVHVNVGNFPPEKVKNLILTYALLEPFFFAFVKPERKDTIYCVPLNYTNLPSIYHKSFNHILDSWHKYTAFNILPVKELGTVEFRHLEGTGNLMKFTTWLNSIKSLYNTVMLGFDPLSILMNKRNIIESARKILPELTRSFTDEQMEEMMYDSVIDVKLARGGIN